MLTRVALRSALHARQAARPVGANTQAARRRVFSAQAESKTLSIADKVGRDVKLVVIPREVRRQTRLRTAATSATVRTMSLPSKIALTMLGVGVAGPIIWHFVLDDATRTKVTDALDKTPLGDVYALVAKKVEELVSPFTEPSKTKLLPDWPIPEVPPNTPPVPVLVIDLEDTLVHSEWSRKHGWRHAKRPGVDEFLETLCQYYEIVIFSQNYFADETVLKLDPKRCALHVLSRDATRYYKGSHVKDLSNLNRDLRQTVIIDDDPNAYQLQPENAIPIKPFTNGRDREDHELTDLIPFLKALAMERLPDFRTVLAEFRDDDGVVRDLPAKYAARVRALEMQKAQEKQKGLGGFIRGRLSHRPSNTSNGSGF